MKRANERHLSMLQEKEAPKLSRLQHGHEAQQEYQASLQQMYGNRWIGTRAADLERLELQRQCMRGMKEPSRSHVSRLIQLPDADQQLWRRFAKLTAEQRQAVLLHAAGSIAKLELWQALPHKWKILDDSIEALKEIRLQRDEALKEGSIYESGALERHLEADNTVNVTGLIAPYRDIVRWLNYKANKQGQRELMQRFELLSTARKKQVLHRLAAGSRLRFTEFAKQVTIVKELKEWVDWTRVSQAVFEAEQQQRKEEKKAGSEQQAKKPAGARAELQDEQENAEYSLLMEENRVNEEAVDEVDWEPDDSSTLEESDRQEHIAGMKEAEQLKWSKELLPLLAGTDLLRGSSEQPEHLMWLLFGTKASEGSRSNHAVKASARAYGQSLLSPGDIVHRYLGIAHLPLSKRNKAERKKLQQLGFLSAQQCYDQLLSAVAALLYKQGVLQKKKQYFLIIERLGLLHGSKLPSKQQLYERLGVHI